MNGKILKKTFAIILTLLIIFSTMPISATSAEITTDGLEYSINENEITITGYTGAKANLIIPSFIENCPVTSIGDKAFIGNTALQSISLPSKITSIGLSAFYNCSNLTYVNIPDDVISIGDCAFYNCSNLKSVDIPSQVTSIGKWTFADCIELESIVLPENITSIGEYAFRGCTSLKNITIPNSVETIGKKAFYGCSSIDSVDIPNNIEIIEECTFAYCTNLKYVTIPEGITHIFVDAFIYCQSMESLTIPSSVIYIDNGVFWGTNLKNVYGYQNSFAETYINSAGIRFVPLAELTNSDTDISVAANSNATLDAEIIEDTQTIEKVDLSLINYSVLKLYDIKLIQDGEEIQPDYTVIVKIPSDNKDAKVFRVESENVLTDMNAVYEDGYMVFATEHFSQYVLAAKNTYTKGLQYIIRDNQVIISGYTGDDSVVTIPETIEGYPVTAIGDYAFEFSSICEINIPNSVTIIGTDAFSCCIGLTILNIPSSVTTIGYGAFSSCDSLKNIIISEGVTSIGKYAFNGCSSLTNIKIPFTVKEIGEWAFEGCGAYVDENYNFKYTIDIYGYSGSYAERYASTYEYNFIPIESDIVPKGLQYEITDNSKFSISIIDYTGDESNLVIPDAIQGYAVNYISKSAFSNCNSLANITIPDSVTDIFEYAFSNCTNLKTVTMGKNVAFIGEYAFNNCINLEEITIGENVTFIGNYAFADCINLTQINYDAIDASENINENSYSIFENAGTASDGIYVVVGDKVKAIPENLFWTNHHGIVDNTANLPPKITSVILGKNVEVIGDGAFARCNELTNIVISSTKLTTIEDEAFAGCGLSTIILPNTLTHIGWSSFNNCPNLTIYGYSNSVAENYASENKITFIALDAKPSTTNPTEPESSTTTEPSSTSPFTTTTVPDTGDFEIGDVNMDGKLNIRDATLIQKYLAKMEDLDDVQLLLADFDANGKVNVKDATAIQKYIAGIK